MEIDSDIITSWILAFGAGIGGGMFILTGEILPYLPMLTIGGLISGFTLYGVQLRLNNLENSKEINSP